jgi:hypothetical protein
MLRVRVRIDDPSGRLHAGLPAYATFGDAAPRAGHGDAR